MKKFQIQRIYYIAAILAVFTFLFSYCSNSSEPSETDNFGTATVEKGNISTKIKVLGNAQFANEQKLRFTQLGKVTKVYFEAGDIVKKDQIIAEFDKTEIENSIRQKEIQLENAKLKLNALYAGGNASQILSATNIVKNSEMSIQEMKKEIENYEKEKAEVIETKTLNTDEYKKTLNNENINRDSDNTDLELALELAKKDVEDKENTLLNAQKELQNQIVFEEQTMGTAENNYSKEVENALLSIQDSLIDTDDILGDINAVLGEDEPTDTNDDYENVLGALNSQSLSDAKNSYRDLKNANAVLEKNYNNLREIGLTNNDDLLNILDETKALLNLLVETSNDTYTLLENTITQVGFTSSDLNTLKSTADANRSTSKTKLSTLQTTVASIENLEASNLTELRSSDAIASKEESVRSTEYTLIKSKNNLLSLETKLESKKGNNNLTFIKAQNAYREALIDKEKTERDYELTLQEKKNNLLTLEQSLLQQKAALRNTEAGDSVALAVNDVIIQELSLEQAKEDLEKYELIAPFDGEVREIDFKIGDNLLADDNKFVYIVDPYVLETSVFLDQVEIIEVQENQQALVTFDSFPQEAFSGVVSSISQSPTEQSGVISYEAIITLDIEEIIRKLNKANISKKKNTSSGSGTQIRTHNKKQKIDSEKTTIQKNPIFSGMTANIEIILQEKLNVLRIQNLSISNNNVTLIKDDEEISTPIKTGLSDGLYTEIIEGLEEGDTIIKIGRTSTTSSKKNTETDATRDFMRATRSGGGSGDGKPSR